MELQTKLDLLKNINPGIGYCWNKRFIRDVSAMKPEALTDKQSEWVDRLLYKYRRQIVSNKALIKAPEKTFISYINKMAYPASNVEDSL